MLCLFLVWLAGFVVCFTWMFTEMREMGYGVSLRDLGWTLIWPVVVAYHWYTILLDK